MQENKYRFILFATFLSVCSFLFTGPVFGVLAGCSENSRQGTASNESGSENRKVAELPRIGEIITTERALELCGHYDFNKLSKRIEDNPDDFKEWKFDGCSMTPDAVLGELIKVPSLTEICLRHDLGYAYGDPGNEQERLEVDRKFHDELLNTGAREFAAKAMFDAVRVGGKEELCLSFSWGFANAAPCQIGSGLKLKK